MVSNRKPKTKKSKKTENQVEDAPMPVPSIEPNAPLKIDEIEEKQESEPQEKSNKKLLVLGGIGLGIVVVATVVLFTFYSMQPQEATKENQTEILPTPTMIPKQVLIRSKWSFEVLNGSGIAGAAKKVADRLIALGYQVVEIGNADRQTYKGNGLFVRQEMMNEVDLMVADLKDTVTIATVAGILKDSTTSARLIIGKE